jgi:hypothetical protein
MCLHDTRRSSSMNEFHARACSDLHSLLARAVIGAAFDERGSRCARGDSVARSAFLASNER